MAASRIYQLKISIVIPVYNEDAVIEVLLKELVTEYPTAQVIVVDDGSTDKTISICASINGVELHQHAYNLGNGAAVKTGIRASTGDIIVMMDGDGQHKPADISRLLSPIIDEHYDMVVGARTTASETELHRDLANSLYNRFATYITGYNVKDLTSGFRAIRTPIAKAFVNILPNGFSYPTTLTLALFRAGFTVKYVPIIAKKRVGKSKISLFKDGIGFLLTILRIGTLFAPMRIFLPIAVVLLGLGISYGAYLLIFQSRFSNMPPLLIIAGLLVFVLGLISEQIALLRMMQAKEK